MIYYYFDIVSNNNNIMRCTFLVAETLNAGCVNLQCIRTEMKFQEEGVPPLQKYTDPTMNSVIYFKQLWKAQWNNTLKTYVIIDPFKKNGRLFLKTSREILSFMKEKNEFDYED